MALTPTTLVLLDNVSIHHTHWPIELIQSVGALVHFIPPHSPALDLVQKFFSKVKACLMENDEADESADLDFVRAAFNFVQQHQMTAMLGSSMLGVYTETTFMQSNSSCKDLVA